MSVVMEESKKLDEFTSQLSAHIWGHRFMDGQRGPEYVLEFLNVLFGAGYSFDQDYYTRRRSVGLRKFVFEGVKEGSAREYLVLEDDEKMRLAEAIQEDHVHVLKQFLRNQEVVLYNATGKEADRSWYARSLYPLHESLLYFELRKKEKRGKTGGELSFERNFYARGGELYYLMLGLGMAEFPNRRDFIQNRFRELLTRNTVIEKVVGKITEAFGEREEAADRKDKVGRLRPESPEDTTRVPLLPPSAPQDNERLFRCFGEEMERLLLLDMDISDMFHLLTSLVCFQLSRYMLERSLLRPESPHYFFDCLDGHNPSIGRQSATSFEHHENLIKERFDHEFEQKMQRTFGDEAEISSQLPLWREQPDRFIEQMGLGQMRGRKKMVVSTLKQCQEAADVRTKLKKAVREAVSDQLNSHQLSITRVIARDGGFATFRRGSASNYRYTLSDAFLRMLVFTKVKPGEKMEYFEFLDRLYTDYGIVIGETEAKKSGVYGRSRLNVRYFQDNERALRDKLGHNGLLVEFSDATAMIQNPNRSIPEAPYV